MIAAWLGACGGAGPDGEEAVGPSEFGQQQAALQAPYGGVARLIPGTIQAEDFDEGGEGVSWHDTTAGNSGGEHRTTDVDEQTCTDGPGCGFNVGWLTTGEWLEYSVNVAATGTYFFEARVSSPGSGGIVHLEVDGSNVTGPLAVPTTGAWQTYSTVRKDDLVLTQGPHVLRFVIDNSGSSTLLGNVNWFRFTRTSTYLSDLSWTSALNGYGPAEKDQSNGEKLAGDGRTLTLNGVTYAKGLGVHAASELVYALDGSAQSLISDIGVDDEVGAQGSVVFQVFADGALLFDSGVMTGSSATKSLQVDLTGRTQLKLVVTPGPDTSGFDHADWADARLVASGSPINLDPMTGRGARIDYTLASKGRVSMIITDAQGKIVRELLHGAPRAAGRQAEIWDGLNDQGLPAPAGTYRYKLLGTPGFKAEYLMTVGNNYPQGNHYRELSPGSHHGSRSVAIDETGIYVGAGQTENIEDMMVKMSLDGSQRLWSVQHQTAWKGVQSLAVDGSELYALSTNTTPELWVFNRTTGQRLRALSIGGPSAPVDVAAQAGTLVVAYEDGNLVRWLDTQGTQLAAAAVTAPRGVAVSATGQTYVLTSTEVRTLSRTGSTSVVVSGLVDPISLDIDRVSGDFLVAEGGTSQRVRRFRSSGTFVVAYGREGGRLDGNYDATTQRNFRGVSEVKATSDGGFLVAEPYAAPRRVARFDSAGALVNEWYGGQVWAPWALPDPEDPSTVWMASEWGWLMKLKLDYAARTWKVVATYRYEHLASGLVGGHINSSIWGITKRNGQTYLIKRRNRSIIKVDEVNQKLMPVSWGGNVSLSNPGETPDVLEPWMTTSTRSANWTDENGDGLPQRSEVDFYDTSGAQVWYPTNEGFDFYYYENHGVRRVKAVSFNIWGAPLYQGFPDGELAFVTPPRVTQVEDRWGSYFARDPQSGDVYGAFNDRARFGTSEDSFVVKWKADGTQAWIVGGPTLGHASAFVPPGAIGTFRRIAGVVDGSVVLTDFYEGPRPGTTYVWDRDGLWAGGVLDNPDTGVAPGWLYGLGAETLASTIVKHPVTGEVFFLGTSINEVRVYRITGWDGWQRAQGDVVLAASPGNPQGTGFRVDFYGDTALSTPVGTQHLAALDLSDRSLPSVRGARWTGELVPASSATYTFRVRADDGVRLWVDGKLVVDAWADTTATRDVTGTVALVAGRRTRLQLDHYRRTTTGNCRLFWSASGLVEQAVPTERVVPVNPLSERPEASGKGLMGEYFQGSGFTLSNRRFTRLDPTVNFNWGTESTVSSPDPRVTYPFSVRWTGTLIPRQTGHYSMTPDLAGSRLWVDGREVAYSSGTDRQEAELIYLEAGKSYPVRVEFLPEYIHPGVNRGAILKWSTPAGTWPRTREVVPATQLFPAAVP
jgi:hypothetical protein